MSRKVWGWLGGFSVFLLLVGAFLTKRVDPAPPHFQRSPELLPDQPVARKSPRLALRTIPQATAEITKEGLLRLLREAAEAYRARDDGRFRAAFCTITKSGSAIQRLLAEVLLEIEGKEERFLAASALQEVATAEIGPFALALVGSDLPEEIKFIAIELLTRFRTPEALPLLGTLLFQKDVPESLKGLMIEYFAALGASEILAKAAVDPSLADLRSAAANALARIGTAHAARLLFDAWTRTFEPKSDKALANYHLLQALARFDPVLLRDLVRNFLGSDVSNSHKNVFLSMLGKADRSFALEVIRELLASETSGSIRGQAIHVLSALGGAEAQGTLLEILLRAPPKEAIESANALLARENLEIPFAEMRGLLLKTQDPMLRVVLASLLARYEADLAADPALAQQLLQEAEAGMAGGDGAVRGLSVELAARLARSTPDRLLTLYGRLSQKERDAFPSVFSELARHPKDARIRGMLESAVGDESTPTPQRLVAADALCVSGGADLVYATIAGARDPQLVGLMSGLALARGGDAGARRLTEIARETPDLEKREILENQVQTWTLQTSGLEKRRFP